MNKLMLATAALATTTLAGVAVATPAHAENAKITATYGCRTATFTNHTKDTAIVLYGRAGSGDEAPEGYVGPNKKDRSEAKVAPGAKVTVHIDYESDAKHFGWKGIRTDYADLTDGIMYPGLDLTKYCSTKNSASKGNGLASTGF